MDTAYATPADRKRISAQPADSSSQISGAVYWRISFKKLSIVASTTSKGVSMNLLCIISSFMKPSALTAHLDARLQKVLQFAAGKVR
jgi:hypothetical protein